MNVIETEKKGSASEETDEEKSPLPTNNVNSDETSEHTSQLVKLTFDIHPIHVHT